MNEEWFRAPGAGETDNARSPEGYSGRHFTSTATLGFRQREKAHLKRERRRTERINCLYSSTYDRLLQVNLPVAPAAPLVLCTVSYLAQLGMNGENSTLG